METVSIGSQPYSAYASLAHADQYLAASQHAGTTWSAATDTNQAQALITATRILDRQRWRDAYADDDLATAQALRFAVQNIKDACVEMALALLDGSELQTEQNTAQKLSSIRAGSVSLSFVTGGTEGAAHRFPTIIHELLRDYLVGGSETLTAAASGVSGESLTENDLGHTGGI